jgi:hypothetical protein
MPCSLDQGTMVLWQNSVHAPASTPNAPAVGCGPCFITLDVCQGSTVTGQLLQHHHLDYPGGQWLGHRFRASNHTISDVGNLTTVYPPNFTNPLSIIIGNRLALPVTSIGYRALAVSVFCTGKIQGDQDCTFQF